MISRWSKGAVKRLTKNTTRPQDNPHQNNNPAFLICSITLAVFVLSLLDTVIAWISLLVACSAMIRVALYFTYQKHMPSVRTLNLLALLCILGLVYSAWPLGFLIGMLNLLVLACALKLMQMRTQRDFYQLVVSLLFLLGCGFIFKQSVAYTLLYSLLTLTVLVSLSFFHAPRLSSQRHLKQVSLLCLQALPIGVLLFLLLPQLPPLWQTPKAKSFETGLSEKITPGDIASLSQSSKLVFRATFEHNVPPTSQRYWRALVMESFDGKSWQVDPVRKQSRRYRQHRQQGYSPVLAGPAIDYDVIAEPTLQQWLYALDISIPRTAKTQAEIYQSDDFLLLSKQVLVSPYQYTVRSYIQALALQPLSDLDRQLNLRIPKQGNPRTREWLATLRQQYPDDQDLLVALMQYFRDQNFTYTLRPNPMFVDPVDTFLFEQQAGFCSHYASALAFILRLAGIPARIVAGYQGGELMTTTRQQQYLSVYQYDAHAWVEAWMPQTGWLRLDPTAVVSPDRINFGLREAMLAEGSFLADSPFTLARFTNIAFFNSLRLLLADIDYNWSRWVLGFDRQKQQDLFTAILGKLSPLRLALLGLGFVSIIALLLILFFIPHWFANRLPPAQRYYQRAVSLLATYGHQRAKWQGAQAFNQQIQQRLPAPVNTTFDHITRLYLQLSYQNSALSSLPTQSDKKALRAMLRAVKRLKRQLARHCQSVRRVA